jgi:hypothetical protein
LERPIFFSPGAFDDEDYLWMKEYLQLDGMVYKLVPKTTIPKDGSPLDMGQNSEKMYTNVMGIGVIVNSKKYIMIQDMSHKQILPDIGSIDSERKFEKAKIIIDYWQKCH